MVEQLITIKPDGSIEGLQVKPGKGVDLTQFGNAEIDRATDIVWDKSLQSWTIKILVGRYKGQYLTCQLFEKETNQNDKPTFDKMIFLNYNQAVQHEVIFLDSVRRNYGTL